MACSYGWEVRIRHRTDVTPPVCYSDEVFADRIEVWEMRSGERYGAGTDIGGTFTDLAAARMAFGS
jgi:hypothetical protein